MREHPAGEEIHTSVVREKLHRLFQERGITDISAPEVKVAPVPFPLELRGDALEQYHKGKESENPSSSVPTLLYREQLDPHLSFHIYEGSYVHTFVDREKQSQQIRRRRFDIHLRYTLEWQGKIYSVKIAELVFKEKPRGYEMPHRIIESQEFGITGSMFLQKTENYLSFLKEHDFLEGDKRIFASAAQVHVIRWFLKNGFQFTSQTEKEFFEEILENRSGRYELDAEDDSDPNFPKRGYIVEKIKKEKWRALNEQLKNTDASPQDIRAFTVRFNLEKIIE